MIAPLTHRVLYIALGIGIGISIAGHATAARPSLVTACPSSTPIAHGAHTFVTDQATGMSVQASGLHADANGDEPPKPGHIYLVIHVLLHNGGTRPADYNPFDFVLHGSHDAHNYDADALDTNISNTALNAGTLQPGRFVAGDLAFEVPHNGQTYTLEWDHGAYGDYMDVPINR